MEKIKEAIEANNTPPQKNTTENSDIGRTFCFLFGELPFPHP